MSNVKAENGKYKISLVVIGHVDSGKSTTTGHLVFKMGTVNQREMDNYFKNASLVGKDSFGFAFVMDKLKAERERGITIACSLQTFETKNCNYTIIDAPGHKDFIKNMITGTSQADVAMLVVPADGYSAAVHKFGSTTKDHALLAYVLGIRNFIVAINKIEMIPKEEQKAKFEEFSEDMRNILGKLNIAENPKKKGAVKEFTVGETTDKWCRMWFVPYSGLKGINLVERAPEEMPWYDGPSLIEVLDQVSLPTRHPEKPLRIPVQDVFKIRGIGTVVSGRIEEGVCKPGMQLLIQPCNVSGKCNKVEMHHTVQEDGGLPGDNVGISLKTDGKVPIKRGHVISEEGEDSVKAIKGFTGRIVVFYHPSTIKAGYSPVVDCHTSHITCQFKTLVSKFLKGSKTEVPNPTELKQGESAVVEFACQKTMVMETYDKCQPLGRFAMRDQQFTVGIGIVSKVEHGLVLANQK